MTDNTQWIDPDYPIRYDPECRYCRRYQRACGREHPTPSERPTP
jgi:hypothetical protein